MPRAPSSTETLLASVKRSTAPWAYFDAFTGASAKEAADKNAALYQQYGTQSLSYLDKGFSGAMPELTNAVNAYTPLSNLGAKYGAGTNMYMNSLGLNGAGGNANAEIGRAHV